MKRISFFLLFISLMFISYAQGQKLPDVLAGKAVEVPEKVYVHFDKNRYLNGDTVWFKAYVSPGSDKTTTSKSMYLDLFSRQGRLLKHISMPIFAFSSSGSLILPSDSSSTGFYCRVYTSPMLRKHPDYIFERFLPVVQRASYVSTSPKRASIKFFPEGGDWINNLPTVMAFEATDQNGRPLAVKGYVKNDQMNIVAEITVRHNGMGSFTIIPKIGNRYIAFWQTENDTTKHQTVLPVAKVTGAVLQITDVKGGKKFRVVRAADTPDADNNLTLLSYAGNKMVYMAKINLQRDVAAGGVIPTDDLPSGFLRITLLDRTGLPLAERLTFINNEKYTFSVRQENVLLDKRKRSLNIIKLASEDSTWANLSVSVTDADFDIPGGNQDNILSYFLLTSELRGKIYDPAYYLSNSDASTLDHLNLLLLTHGWRKYTVDKSPNGLSERDEYDYLTIKGQARLPGLKGFKNIYATLTTPDSSITVFKLPVDKTGSFNKSGVIFYGDAKLDLRVDGDLTKLDSSRLHVTNGLLQASDVDTVVGFNNVAAVESSAVEQILVDHYKDRQSAKTLKEVLIKGKRQSKIAMLDEKYTGGLFKAGISTTINVGDDPKAPNNESIFQYLQSKVAGLIIFNPLSLSPSATWRGESVAFYLNNVRTEPADIRNLFVRDFDYIKVYDPSQGGAFGAPGGVVAAYTKKGKGGSTNTGGGGVSVDFNGYSVVKEYYSPDYAVASPLNDSPDRRSSLLWKPNIIFEAKRREYVLKYYNNDVSKKHKLVIEGMNAEGKLCHIEKIY